MSQLFNRFGKKIGVKKIVLGAVATLALFGSAQMAFAAPGTLDTTFPVGAAAEYSQPISLKLPDGGYLITRQLPGSPTFLTKVSANGVVDTNFNAGFTNANFSGAVRDMEVTNDGYVMIVGSMTSWRGSAVPRGMVKINYFNGDFDYTFLNNRGAGGGISPSCVDSNGAAYNNCSTIYSVAERSDGTLLFAGNFNTFPNSGTTGVGILNGDGTPFQGTGLQVVSRPVTDVDILPDGSAVFVGQFTMYGGFTAPKMAKVSASNVFDSTFRNNFTANPAINFNNAVFISTVQHQSDGKIIIAGAFANGNNATNRNGIARFNANGTYDNTFNPSGVGPNTYSDTSSGANSGGVIVSEGIPGFMRVLSNDKIVISSNNMQAYDDGVQHPVTRIVRINANGTYDSSFQSGTGLGTYPPPNDNYGNGALGITENTPNSVLLTGIFQTYNGTVVNGLARIGTPDNLVELSANSTASTNESNANNFPSLIVSGVFSSSATVQLAVNSGTAAGGGVDYTYSTQTITIPAGTYNSNTITIPTAPTLVQDSLIEGNENIVFQLQSPSGQGLQIGDVNGNSSIQSGFTYTITDDDTASFSRTPGTLTVAENNGTSTFAVQLGAQPNSNVVINVTSGNTADATVSVPSLTFTNANWNVAQVVTVTGVNDVIDRNDTATITLSVNDATSDNNFDPLADQTVSVTLTDDDTAGAQVSTSTVSIAEGGATGTYTIALLTEPTANVTVNYTANAQASRAPALVFTPLNWNVAQTVTVTAVDDTTVENAHSTTLAHTITSSDTAYAAVVPASVTANITDNEFGVTVTQSGGTTTLTEGGATDTIDIMLSAAPTATVNIALTPSSQQTIDVSTLTFTTANWNVAQAVTVTAVDDVTAEGTHSGQVAYALTSLDTNYNGFVVPNTVSTITDNDTAGFTRTPNTLTISENAGTSTVSVVLDRQPLTDVVIDVTSNAATQGTVSVGSLTFTSTNWNIAQAVTVIGVNDNTDTPADDTATITFAINDAASDSVFDPVVDQTVLATFTDDDTAGATFTPNVTIVENANDTASVVLTAQPLGNVVINITSADTGSVTVSPSTLTFTPANWNIAQIVTMTAVDDADTANEITNITAVVNDALSSNEYDTVTDKTVTVNVTDDDMAGITATPNSITALPDTNTSSTQVVLTAQPGGDVVLNVVSANTAKMVASPATLTFTSANWNVAQTVTLTPVLDIDIVDDTTVITLSVNTASSHSSYATAPSRTISVTVQDMGDIDNDGIPNEQDPDMDGDGTINFFDTDTDGDGIPNGSDTDDDGDGTPDGSDPSSNGPGNPGDIDGDGIPNGDDGDTDGDGTPNVNDPDTDGDGTPNGSDSDDDGDGTPDNTDTSSNGPGSLTDFDNDGTPNSIENAGFNAGDGNGDGTPDRDQQNVSSNVNPVTGAHTTIQSVGACSFIEQNSYLAEGAMQSPDLGFDYPVGLAKFKLRCATPGASATVKLFYAQAYNSSTWTYRKFRTSGLEYANITPIVTFGTQTVGTSTVTTVTFTATDGNAQTDEDGIADGVINDPSGPAISVPIVTSGGGGGAYSPAFYTQEYQDALKKSQQAVAATNATTTQNTVLGGEANVPVEFSNYVCKRNIRSYIGLSSTNNATDVRALQVFLNTREGESLVVDGAYDTNDIAAVKRFQTKYANQILYPWGLTEATGKVGRTTTAKINLMSCQGTSTSPYFNSYLKQGDSSLDVVKLKDFLNVIFYPTSGYPTSGLVLSKTFDSNTAAKLREFQAVYKDTVLKPWKLTAPTGRFYQTTRKASNLLTGFDEGDIKLK